MTVISLLLTRMQTTAPCIHLLQGCAAKCCDAECDVSVVWCGRTAVMQSAIRCGATGLASNTQGLRAIELPVDCCVSATLPNARELRMV
ncbi:hypothetical protein ACFFJ4_11065 [Xanthomonas dyei]|uniref:hypothetical protein n=1 Tax=Xanthomonas dyei TaxID=743699 RepID=UPI0011B01CD8|nr:hypothetical protein [Xanthomonas dyei]